MAARPVSPRKAALKRHLWLAGTALAALPALAFAQGDDVEEIALDEVVITGTSIKGVAGRSSSPTCARSAGRIAARTSAAPAPSPQAASPTPSPPARTAAA